MITSIGMVLQDLDSSTRYLVMHGEGLFGSTISAGRVRRNSDSSITITDDRRQVVLIERTSIRSIGRPGGRAMLWPSAVRRGR